VAVAVTTTVSTPRTQEQANDGTVYCWVPPLLAHAKAAGIYKRDFAPDKVLVFQLWRLRYPLAYRRQQWRGPNKLPNVPCPFCFNLMVRRSYSAGDYPGCHAWQQLPFTDIYRGRKGVTQVRQIFGLNYYSVLLLPPCYKEPTFEDTGLIFVDLVTAPNSKQNAMVGGSWWSPENATSWISNRLRQPST
jgi:hypothetical protein